MKYVTWVCGREDGGNPISIVYAVDPDTLPHRFWTGGSIWIRRNLDPFKRIGFIMSQLYRA